MSSSESESEYVFQLTPPEILQAAKNIKIDTLPLKSQNRYWKAYETFNKWRMNKKLKVSMNTILAYFGELAKKYKSSTLWCTYSKLRATIEQKHRIKIETYTDLLNFLKSKSKGYEPKKSKVLSPENVKNFLQKASNETYLATKVALIFGIYGACRHGELVNIKLNDVKDLGPALKIALNDTKNKTSRQFIIENEHAEVVRKYLSLRPNNGTVDRFFLTYRDGKCVNLPIGKNKFSKMPYEIATFLKLPTPDLYTGHSFRRSSATMCAEQGVQIDDLKRFGGWKSATVAEGYIDISNNYKRKTSKKICNVIAETSDDSENTTIEPEHKKPKLDRQFTQSNTEIKNISAMASYQDKVTLNITNSNVNIHFHN